MTGPCITSLSPASSLGPYLPGHNGRHRRLRVAVLSVHGCPIVRAGEKDAGGMNVYVLETARALGARGVLVDVYTRAHDPADPQVVGLGPGARLVHMAAGPLRPEKDGVYNLLPAFIRRVREFARRDGASYDLVASHYWLSGVAGLELSRGWDVPHVTSFHTLAEVKRRARPGEREVRERAPSERIVTREADRVIAWSSHERDLLASLYGADPGRVLVIPPGVDNRAFRPLDQRRSRATLGIPDSARVVLYVGRVERLKGIEILLQAVAGMEEEDGVRLFIVGGAPGEAEQQRLKRVAASLDVLDRVEFTGSVPRERLPLYYSAADVSVFPSYYESFGLAALESSACGTPVIASRVGGLPSVVHEGETGYLIPWRCPAAFIQRLEIILFNDHLRAMMGRAARAHAEELGWDVVVDRLEQAFESVVRQRAAGAAPLTLLAGGAS